MEGIIQMKGKGTNERQNLGSTPGHLFKWLLRTGEGALELWLQKTSLTPPLKKRKETISNECEQKGLAVESQTKSSHFKHGQNNDHKKQ